ncbi:MAG: PAS domain-containing sensor histidine kinase, partial [Chloroflexota bacterium]
MFNIKSFRSNQSIIQMTLFKMTLSISLFLIAFWILYGQNYWEKEALKTYGQLLLTTSDVQSEIQSQINHIDWLTDTGKLTIDQKKTKIRELLRPVVENRYDGNGLDFGYYDLKLDSILTIEEVPTNDLADKIRATLGLKREFQNFTWDNDGVITVSLPVYDREKIVGYAWTSAKNSDIIFNSGREVSVIMILVVGLTILILVFVRKQMKQIRLYLEMFCKMIMDNEYEKEQ